MVAHAIPLVASVLNIGAALVYLWQRDYWRAAYWFAASLVTLSTTKMK